jgi:hypothetical protein
LPGVLLGAGAVLLGACMLLVHFDPEGQPCDESGNCLAGFICRDGLCRSANGGGLGGGAGGGDGGLPKTCTACPSGQVCDRDTGSCVACSPHEMRCDDGLDDDCDGLTDCDDPDCLGLQCDDKNSCTSAEACQSDGTCAGGTVLDCSAPPNDCSAPEGTCDPATGACVYPPIDAGTACDDSSVCTLGDHCDGAGHCIGASTVSCNAPPTMCFELQGVCDADAGCIYTPKLQGTVCDDGNPCTRGEACDDGGTCSGGTGLSCVSPPGPCFARQGACDATGTTCTYKPLASGTACSDGNACTVGDTCNATGACVPGPSCPNSDPCKTRSCVAGACVYANRGNGTSCGSAASKRCCGGNCVDISSDRSNCGGCGSTCASGYACESVAVTTQCSPHPASTSGRCRCAANSQCPRNQICTTVYATLRCAPPAASNCAAGEVFHDVQLCPNYCSY